MCTDLNIIIWSQFVLDRALMSYREPGQKQVGFTWLIYSRYTHAAALWFLQFLKSMVSAISKIRSASTSKPHKKSYIIHYSGWLVFHKEAPQKVSFLCTSLSTRLYSGLVCIIASLSTRLQSAWYGAGLQHNKHIVYIRTRRCVWGAWNLGVHYSARQDRNCMILNIVSVH